MMQMHELGISPLERGPAFQAAGADVCIDVWVHAGGLSPDFCLMLFLKPFCEHLSMQDESSV